ncbi:hypothetical protein EVAR_84995_1 [Eumeta japonica]|uniref:Uncharacterized protein n=1 Tax=Eumeta variegata TaxID=151549 RepID=A0A4C1W8P6_EUMVA|nr:hypothetical protein EVAR_84995_1 [Eumeta japonica]
MSTLDSTPRPSFYLIFSMSASIYLVLFISDSRCRPSILLLVLFAFDSRCRPRFYPRPSLFDLFRCRFFPPPVCYFDSSMSTLDSTPRPSFYLRLSRCRPSILLLVPFAISDSLDVDPRFYSSSQFLFETLSMSALDSTPRPVCYFGLCRCRPSILLLIPFSISDCPGVGPQFHFSFHLLFQTVSESSLDSSSVCYFDSVTNHGSKFMKLK